jgi:PEGA domain
MRMMWTLAASLTAAVVLVGCQSIPPGAERGPHHTMAYDVLVDASAPGARVEVNGQDMGQTPLHIKIFGDPDGTFHDFGSYFYVVRALPVTTNQYAQAKYFRTGHMMTPEDHIPARIYFDMNEPAPAPPPDYYYYYAPPPPAYYYGPPYYGPEFQFYIGPGYHHHHW